MKWFKMNVVISHLEILTQIIFENDIDHQQIDIKRMSLLTHFSNWSVDIVPVHISLHNQREVQWPWNPGAAPPRHCNS